MAKIALQRSTPEAQGIASSAIGAFVTAVESDINALHSFMLLRHGAVVAEGWWRPYAPDYPHMLFSLSKSFTSTAVGMAIAEGRLTLDDRVVTFFPEDLPPRVSQHLEAMRVRDLLAMATGHAKDTTGAFFTRRGPKPNWVQAFLSLPVKYRPGEHFLYNTGATYMLSAIVQKVSGATLLEYLRPRLFEPLGIENPAWESCPRGINTGGFGLSVTTEDIARFGQLYLQRGRWGDRQLLPEAWVAAATQTQIANGTDPNSDWAQGYGYQFWRCRHGAYRGDGAFGQYCLVMPNQDAVLAITSGLGDMQPVLNLVWEHLLPAFKPEALPEAAAEQTALQQRLAELALPPQAGGESPLAAQVSGRRYTFAGRSWLKALTCTFDAEGCVITLRDRRGEHQIACGDRVWRLGSTTFSDDQPGAFRIAASGAWVDAATYVAQVCYCETPFTFTFTCRFEGDAQLTLNARANVSFGPVERPQLVGKALKGK